MPPLPPLPLPMDASPSSIIQVNARVLIREEGGVLVVCVAGLALLRYERADAAGRALAMVTLVQDGYASVSEVARAFECARLSIYRYIERYENDGVGGLVHGKRGPKGPHKLGGASARRMLALKHQGRSNAQIGAQLGVTASAVRAGLTRVGYAPTPLAAEQQSLLEPAAPAESQDAPASEPSVRETDEQVDDVSPALGSIDHADSAPVAINDAAPMLVSNDHAPTAPGSIDHAVPVSEPVDSSESLDSHDASAHVMTAVSSQNSAAIDVAPSIGGGALGGGATAGVTHSTTEPQIPQLEAQSTADTDPSNRALDRLFARMGLIDDAAPLFGTCSNVPGAGVLLAIPALLQSDVFGTAQRVYGGLGPAFYGLRNIILTLLFMALLRVKRPETLRHTSPPNLGRLLGLDRGPEVKTLRRKLKILGGRQKSEEFVRELARARVRSTSAALGFLYVDGHVRVYNGKQTISKAHVTQMRLAMPATVDHWVNDANGDPVFVVTATPTVSLARELPPVLTEIRSVLGDRRLTVVFDRGGWSPKLFKEMIAQNFDILTYRKGRYASVRRDRFREQEAKIEGRTVKYMLAERKIVLENGALRLREVVRLSDNKKHQTSIVTSRTDLSAIELAYRMFERWRQENFFKYMSAEFALDALVEYGVEAADGERLVLNPMRKELDKKVSEVRGRIRELERRYGEAAANNEESSRPTMRGFKIANGTIGQDLRVAKDVLEKLVAERRAIPTKVPAKEAADDGQVVRLRTEAKRLTDALKMVAYQAETALFRLLDPHYSRNQDEGRKLIASCFRWSGDITVTEKELHVTLDPAASPNRTRALEHLCNELTAMDVRFPGSDLRVRYAIKGR